MHISEAIGRLVRQRSGWKPATTWTDESGRTGWTDSGDPDWSVIVAAQDEVKAALEHGRVKAWEGGNGTYREVPSIEWVNRVPALNFNSYGEHSERRIWIKRADAAALWPDANSSGQSEQSGSLRKARGRPREINHDWLESRARQIVSERPDISRASLAGSLIKEMAPGLGREVDQRGVERILEKLNLPRGD